MQNKEKRKGAWPVNITFSERKDLPNEGLHALFAAVGWADAEIPRWMLESFNKPFMNSGYVVSAWEGERLIGCARVLSDGVIRSILWDLAVLPEYQGKGIGSTLVEKCKGRYPGTHWLLATIPERKEFYERLGFSGDDSLFMSIPCKYF